MCARHHRELVERLDELRNAGAAALGVEPPRLEQLRRVSSTNAIMAVGGLVAVAFLLADVGDPGSVWATLRTADWSWLGFALALSLVANVAYAVALQGTVRVRLPVVETTEVQLGMSFSNLAVPAIGGQGMQVRFLQKLGVDLGRRGRRRRSAERLRRTRGRARALRSGAARRARPRRPVADPHQRVCCSRPCSRSGWCSERRWWSAPSGPCGRRVVPPTTRALVTIWDAFRSPWQMTLLVGGNAVATLLSTWCLMACLAAFGGGASFWSLLAANIGVVTIASLVPIPGGGTAVGTVGLSAVLVSFGVTRDVAVAAVLANQLAYYYLPAVPGWFATRDLIRRDYL